MRAWQLVRWQAAPELREVRTPEPGPGQVLLKVAGAGVCHSDLHLFEWAPGALPYELPFTLGHENAGWVERVGPGVTGLAPGEAAIVYGPWGCGRCKRCLSGGDNLCENAAQLRGNGGGLGADGGMAPFLLVPQARWLVPLRQLDPRAVAPLADAGLTPYHAIRRSRELLTPDATAVVIGAGGLGQTAVRLLRATCGARVLAVDLSARKRERARGLGADDALASDERVADAVRARTRGRGADVVLDMVGADATLRAALAMLRTGGHVTIVGLGGGTAGVSALGSPWECSVQFSYWGTLPELHEVVALAEAGRIASENEYFPLEEADEAWRRLRRGEIRERAVVLPNG